MDAHKEDDYWLQTMDRFETNLNNMAKVDTGADEEEGEDDGDEEQEKPAARMGNYKKLKR